MDFAEVLGKSWKIVWKHKVLWIFGLLASCSRNGGGGGGGGGSGYDFSSGSGNGGSFMPGFENFLSQVNSFFDTTPIWLVIAVLLSLICLLMILSVVLGTFGRIGLVRGAWLADDGAERLTFGQIFSQSWPYFWRVLLLVILFALAGLMLGLVLLLPILLVTVFTLGCGLLCLIPLLIVLFWAIEAWLEQSIVAVVGEDLGVMAALQRGWSILRNNPAQVGVMALILNIGYGILTFLMLLPALAIILPAVAGVLGASLAENETWVLGGIGVSVALLCLYMPVALLARSVAEAYMGSAWTLTFRRLASAKPPLDIEPLAGPPDQPAAGLA